MHFSGNKQGPRILLVDDDPLFGRLMEQTAKHENIQLMYFNKAKEVYERLENLNFDVAVIDFNLGNVNGVQLSHFMERILTKFLHKNTPVILISGNKSIDRLEWPHNITEFISKSQGTLTVLSAALSAYDKQYPHD